MKSLNKILCSFFKLLPLILLVNMRVQF